jgi:hypothetical protein
MRQRLPGHNGEEASITTDASRYWKGYYTPGRTDVRLGRKDTRQRLVSKGICGISRISRICEVRGHGFSEYFTTLYIGVYVFTRLPRYAPMAAEPVKRVLVLFKCWAYAP